MIRQGAPGSKKRTLRIKKRTLVTKKRTLKQYLWLYHHGQKELSHGNREGDVREDQVLVDGLLSIIDRWKIMRGQTMSNDLTTINTSVKPAFSYGIELLNEDGNYAGYDDFSDFEYYSTEKGNETADKIDYIISMSSGLITAVLDILWVKELSLTEASKWGDDAIEKFVINTAKSKANYTGDDLKVAIKKLEEKFPIPADSLINEFGGGLQHHLRDYVHHPTILGLGFSILSQFTGKGFGTDTQGNFRIYDLKNKEHIGKNTQEKILFGTVDWAMHLISDMAGSSTAEGRGTGVPGPLLSTMKELSSLPFFKDMKVTIKKNNRNDEDANLSKVVSKIFNGTLFAEYDDNGRMIQDTVKPFDLRTEVGIVHALSKQMLPVIANECIVRGFYFIRRLCDEIKVKNIVGLKQLVRVDRERVLPYNNRAITRMITVSSGVFMAVTSSKAFAKGIVTAKGDKKQFVKTVLLNLNYPGIARFAISCKQEIQYFANDIVEAYRKRLDEIAENETKLINEITAIRQMELNPRQAQILMSLEAAAVRYDIFGTKRDADKNLKIQWLNQWLSQTNYPLISDKEELYRMIRNDLRYGDKTWIYLIAMELYSFVPYTPLGLFPDMDELYSKLKFDNGYTKKLFCWEQAEITLHQYKKLSNELKKNGDVIAGKAARRKIGAAAMIAVTFATGGAAFAFAPEIAVLLAGESVAGLSGAALTSASLAAVGGGSLAAGGLGMAGGTAIITGGGAVFGIAGSGITATINALAAISDANYSLDMCRKMLTYATYVLPKQGEYSELKSMTEHLGKDIRDIEWDIGKAESKLIFIKDKKELTKQKQRIKSSKKVLKQLVKCRTLMQKKYDELSSAIVLSKYIPEA